MNVDLMREQYRSIRKDVFNSGTMPLNFDSIKHQHNQQIFKDSVIRLAKNADLKIYKNNDADSITNIWHHLWTKNRYAGIRSQIATTEINHIRGLFDNYKRFVDSDWNVVSVHGDHNKLDQAQSGQIARDFVNRTGDFKDKQTIGNIPKLKKVVHIARILSDYFDNNPGANALDFVTNNNSIADWRSIQQYLLSIGYKADLTSLHFMMDIGLPVIKPDVVISRLFLRWKWLHYAIPNLPEDLTEADLLGKGVYRTSYLYTKPKIYVPIINLANEIVNGINPNDLENDIGWVTNNALREFDIFIVKSGQQPEIEFGIEKQLFLREFDEISTPKNTCITNRNNDNKYT